ncbi:OsmC family peroxiredoxin [Cellulomonas sp. JZ18]|uniref:OsmC family protein n=1 Tax=Cellulomonas sp. JZ18 TaxID=2654191 RepID=UPI0012D464ED|nr:OsmC family protein [Cellulomonas sp. JZ18]QGQ19269.1 OsmC family peroxiredoxin [Cellulomonas sp. JZ18]
MADLSPLGVSASAGTLRGPGVTLAHAWTPQGVAADPVTNGAQVLHLAVAVCVLNDVYREARALGVEVRGVRVVADGGFDEAWRSTGVTYRVQVDGPTSADAERLLARVDEVAEVPRALRFGVPVARA